MSRVLGRLGLAHWSLVGIRHGLIRHGLIRHGPIRCQSPRERAM
jgi:hypothetical protein